MEKATAANDPQCSNCTYAHHNMAGQFGEGWCYLFRHRMEGCSQKKVQPGDGGAQPEGFGRRRRSTAQAGAENPKESTAGPEGMKAETPFQRVKSITTKNGCMACLVHHHHGLVVDRWNNTPVSLAEAGSLAQSWIKVIRQGKYIYVLIPEGREPDAEECAVIGAMAVYATASLSFFNIQFVPNTHES